METPAEETTAPPLPEPSPELPAEGDLITMTNNLTVSEMGLRKLVLHGMLCYHARF